MKSICIIKQEELQSQTLEELYGNHMVTEKQGY